MKSLWTRSFSLTVLAIAGLTAGAGVQAQGKTDYSIYGPGTTYIGLNAGRSDFAISTGFGGFPSDKRDTVYNIYSGTFFSPNFGLELGYTHFGTVNRAGGTTKAEGINFSLVGKVPLGSSPFNLLGKVGTTYGRTDVSAAPFSGVSSGRETGFGVSYGLGAEYVFSPQISAVVQYDEHKLRFVNAGRDRVGAATLGLRYRF